MRRFFTPSKESAAHTIINPPKEGERAAGGRILPPRTSKDWWQARENHLRVMNSRRPN